MMDTHQLEEMVIAIHNKTTRSSECVIDEYFAESIEQKMELLPVSSRDEFMRIAIEHGYKTPAERSGGYTPQADGFDEPFYDDMFPLNSSDELH